MAEAEVSLAHEPSKDSILADALRLAYQKLHQSKIPEAIADLELIKQDCDSKSAFHAEVTLILGDAKRLAGDFDSAYLYIIEAMNQCPSLKQNISINTVFTCLANLSQLPPDCALVDEHIKTYLSHPMTISKTIDGIVKHYLMRRMGIQNGLVADIVISDLAKDKVLHLAMNHLVLSNRDLEVTLMTVRRELLRLASEDLLSESFVPLITAFGFRAALNEYINPVSEAEQSAINQIVEHLGDVNKENLATYKYDLLLLAMYMPFSELPSDEELVEIPLKFWPKELKLLAIQTLFDIKVESHIAALIPDFTRKKVCNPNIVSRKVRQQYEESPYPRWKKLGIQPNKKTYSEHYAYLKSHTLFKQPKSYDLLVAGCGTGEHPLQDAALIKNLSITALDLSAPSLAYGERKRKEFKIKNVKFFRGDILDLHESPKRYDIVESVGVLHHMADPAHGLKNILNCLKPNGVIQLGLYSVIARRPFQILREHYKTYIGDDGTVDKKRVVALRNDLLRNRNPDLYWADHAFDFYCFSGFRDLLFHAQEHQFTIPMIVDLLSECNLKFLGFHLPGNVIRHKLSLFPGESSSTDLLTWANYEEMYPSTFLRMYNFHCCRK